MEAAPKAAPAEAAPSGRTAEIYIGHSKDQVEEKKAGAKGRFVVDDPSKYPARTEFVGACTPRLPATHSNAALYALT